MLAARKPILILGEPGTGHEIAARALQLPEAPFVALPNGARLADNPLQLLEEARDGTLYCAEIGQYSKAEQKGLAFLLPKLDRHSVDARLHQREPLGNLAAEGRFDPALLAQLSAGAVLLPPLRARREDIPAADRALLARRSHRASASAAACSPTLPAGRARRARQRVLAGQPRPPAQCRRQPRADACAGEITPDHVKRLLGEAAPPNQAIAPEITARFFELPLREAREAFERIYFEQLLGREQSNMSRVADKAGLERTHLYRKLKQLNIRFCAPRRRRASRLNAGRRRRSADHGRTRDPQDGQRACVAARRRRDRRRLRRHRHEPALHAAHVLHRAPSASR